MKTRLLILPVLLAAPAFAQPANEAPEAPVPVTRQLAAPAPAPAGRPAEPQRLYGPSAATLIAPDAAKNVLDRFRAAFPNQRIVIYVNRSLVDLDTGLRLTGHTEHYENSKSSVKSDMETPAAAGNPQTQINVSVSGNAGNGNATPTGKGTASNESDKTSGQNTYALKDGTKATVADQQTVREVERLFGRVFRNGGAKLADQKTASSLLGDQPGRLVGTSDQAAKDRAALASIADIAIEILISSRNLTVAGVSGDQSYSVPDIQATAIQLKDSAIIGQASASDVIGKDAQAGRIVQTFDVRDITEATAIALAEDMLTGK
ncbi:MAG: hypothetical protein JWM32_1836 [Verrucomicrobia bacterium]|nr:hypothetical protein [Verrucomicrobiota bacterium]